MSLVLRRAALGRALTLSTLRASGGNDGSVTESNLYVALSSFSPLFKHPSISSALEGKLISPSALDRNSVNIVFYMCRVVSQLRHRNI